MTMSMTQTQTLTPSMKRQRRADLRRNALYLVLIGIGLVAPFVAYPVFLMKVLCFALFACAFNLLLGYAGLLSFGHAAFLATGGYITGYLLASHPGLTPELGILAGTLTAVALGAVFGAVAIRRQGIYFAMVTLALSQLVYFLFSRRPSPAARMACTGCRGASCSA
jgi:branched-chain amino acid transport system permease protein